MMFLTLAFFCWGLLFTVSVVIFHLVLVSSGYIKGCEKCYCPTCGLEISNEHSLCTCEDNDKTCY